MVGKPARMEGPSTTQRKYMEIVICMGPDQTMLMYVIMSLNRWASTDIRFTISPTVDVRLAALDSFNICGKYIQLLVGNKI